MNHPPETIKGILDKYREELRAIYDEHEAEAITFLVAGKVLEAGRMEIIMNQHAAVPEEKREAFLSMLEELKDAKPVQYVLGETEFYGLPFRVDARVLIPRPETEELVDLIIKENRKCQDLSILDICTGSGCIAIALKKNLPAEVYAVDISEDALQLAQENAQHNHCPVSFIKADALDPGFTIHRKLSVIVSNPPYVPDSQKKEMHRNVLNFEPHLALFVKDDDPLIFYRAIADFATENLEKGGRLYFEINEKYGPGLEEMLQNKGFVNIRLRKDLSGRDRMLSCEHNQ